MTTPTLPRPLHPTLTDWRAATTDMLTHQVLSGRNAASCLHRLGEMRGPVHGVGGWLKQRFAVCVALRPTFRDYRGAKTHAARLGKAAYSRTVATFDPIIHDHLADTDLAQLTEFRAYRQHLNNSQTLWQGHRASIAHVDAVLHALKACAKESGEAKNWEWADAFSNNAGINLLSYAETEEAKDSIQTLNRSLEALSEHRRKNPALFSAYERMNGVKDPRFSFWLDILEVGPFGSLGNIDRLNTVLESLPAIHKAAMKLRAGAFERMADACLDHRREAQALDRFRADMIRHLAPGLGMTRADVEMARAALSCHHPRNGSGTLKPAVTFA